MAVNWHVPTGPLSGLRVVEFASIGPGPFACMLLSDLGADVVCVDRPDAVPRGPADVTSRGRTTVRADLKNPDHREQVLSLLDEAEVLIEGFRPGVMERLGLGPQQVLQRAPRLVYGRMTGWGQTGPYAQRAGHDINYIAITGALHAIGAAGGPPVPPLNLVGDYGGGSLYLVMGVLAALLEARQSGRGQVVDAAITDGVLSMLAPFFGHLHSGRFKSTRGTNLLDGGGAAFYGVYETADGHHVSVGPIEPKFFAELCELLGVAADLRDAQFDAARQPALRAELAACIRRRSRDDWTALAALHDACLFPILSLSEAITFPANLERGAIATVAGVPQPAPAPRFSRTPAAIQAPPMAPPSSVQSVLDRWRQAPSRR